MKSLHLICIFAWPSPAIRPSDGSFLGIDRGGHLQPPFSLSPPPPPPPPTATLRSPLPAPRSPMLRFWRHLAPAKCNETYPSDGRFLGIDGGHLQPPFSELTGATPRLLPPLSAPLLAPSSAGRNRFQCKLADNFPAPFHQ